MFDHYWARVRFSARERQLDLLMRSTGWNYSYVLSSGEELMVFAHMSDPGRFHVKIPPGAATELEVLIHPWGFEELRVGSLWSIQYSGDQVLGTCELVELFARWRDKSEEPAGMRDRGVGFFAI